MTIPKLAEPRRRACISRVYDPDDWDAPARPRIHGFTDPVEHWLRERFGGPTEIQSDGWQAIARGDDTLLMAPTGSGKTLAAFLAGIDALLVRSRAGTLEDTVKILYISPLKALTADIERNLQGPLQAITAAATELGQPVIPPRVAVRTGDTTPSERAQLLRHPPHLLLTTPESLYLLLTATRGRELLAGCEQVILDEIHTLVGNKRGAHLALSLERLDALCHLRPQRIGLSATIDPPDLAAQLLSGVDANGAQQPCTIIDAGRDDPLDLAVEVPQEPLSAVASRTAWDDIYARICLFLADHRTTLIFVPSRRLAERVAHDLELRLGEGIVAAHHGALAKRTRQSVERRLQTGGLKAVVATASLELGIDIGEIDLVIQLGSPRCLSVLRQRVGRACHHVGGTPKGRIFAMTRDELLELAAAVRAIRHGHVDRPLQVRTPLDILAQQLVAACSAETWNVDDLWALVRRAAPYHNLDRRDFDEVLDMLADGITTQRGRASALLHYDRIHGQVSGRRGARLAALTSGGAIADKADYAVIEHTTEAVIGSVDEDFAIDSSVGDIFQLGAHAWRIRQVEQGRVRVDDARGQAPTIPFWNGEGLARSPELSLEVSNLRQTLADLLATDQRAAAEALLLDDCRLSPTAVAQALLYIHEGAQALGTVPTHTRIVAERFFDESGGMQLVLHAPFGARINRAFGHGLRKKFCRTFDFELQAAATDDAVLLSLGPQHSFPLETIFALLQEHAVDEALTQAALQSPMWETRWRATVTRSLAVLRHSGGQRVPPPILRMRAADLLAAVFPAQAGCQDNHGGPLALPDHPLVRETAKECLEDIMDAAGLKQVLRQLAAGDISRVTCDTVRPSPFAHAILASNPYTYLDDAPLEERWARQTRSDRPGQLTLHGGDLLTLAPDTIASVVASVRLDANPPRTPDELHDLLCAPHLLPPEPAWAPLFSALVAAGRACQATITGPTTPTCTRWVAAEVTPVVAALWPDAHLEPTLNLPPTLASRQDPDDAAFQLVRAWLAHAGPVTATTGATALGLPVNAVEAALLRLELAGLAVQGQFSGPDQWCARNLLQRIHRQSRARLRDQVRSVSPATCLRFLLRWQHVHPGTQCHGPEGLLQVIEQLEGLELPAHAWEREILPRRVANYDPAWLDALCSAGEVSWARITALADDSLDPGRLPRNAGKISLFLRAHAPFLITRWLPAAYKWPFLTPLARRVAATLEAGAAFANDLRASLEVSAQDLEEALWDLVRVGAITSDSFASMRWLCAADRPTTRPLYGRWSLLSREFGHIPAPDPFGDGSPVALAWVYLHRYGVIARPLLARESAAPSWPVLVEVYRRLEARGEIRGGRFVAGLQGEQFALPEALLALKGLGNASDEIVDVAAVDPLNLAGILTPGHRVPALRGHILRYRDGTPSEHIQALTG